MNTHYQIKFPQIEDQDEKQVILTKLLHQAKYMAPPFVFKYAYFDQIYSQEERARIFESILDLALSVAPPCVLIDLIGCE